MTSTALESNFVMHDIIFKDIPDQYVHGEDITVVFSGTTDTKIDQENDSIGLIRIGSVHVNECLAYAKIEIEETAGSIFGRATFLASDLPICEEEFYQFSYIQNKQKVRGTSIPFQLNCSPDDIDLLTSTIAPSILERVAGNSIQKDGLYEIPDQDNEDLIVIHTKRMLTEDKLRQENRHLFDMNQNLAKENELFKVKFNDYISKVQREMEALKASHKTAINELSSRQQIESKIRNDYEAIAKICTQYQKEALDTAERYRVLKNSVGQSENQLALALAEVKEKSSKLEIVTAELENMSQALKFAEDARVQAEKNLKDLHSTSENFQKKAQASIEALTKEAAQQENQIHALETANTLLKEELKAVRDENLLLAQQLAKDQLILSQLQTYRSENEKLRQQLDQARLQQEEHRNLVNCVAEIKNRCLKHQKGELEVKKQLAAYKEHVKSLQDENQELRERLAMGSDEYKVLYRKFHAAEQMLNKLRQPVQHQNPTSLSNETGLNEEALVSLLQSSYQIQQQEQLIVQKEEEKKPEADHHPQPNGEIRECPMCYWEFPIHMTLENKKDHIEAHFD